MARGIMINCHSYVGRFPGFKSLPYHFLNTMGLSKLLKLPEPWSPHVSCVDDIITGPHTFAIMIKSDNPCKVSALVNAF